MITNESTNHGNLWLAILASIGVALLASILYIVIYNLGKISVAVSFLVALAASYVYIKIYKMHNHKIKMTMTTQMIT